MGIAFSFTKISCNLNYFSDHFEFSILFHTSERKENDDVTTVSSLKFLSYSSERTPSLGLPHSS